MKREKTIKMTILLASLFILIYLIARVDFGKTARYEELLVDATVYQEIKADRTEMTQAEAPELLFDDFMAPYDSRSNTYLYSVIEDSPTKFDPQIHSISTELTQYDLAVYGDILNEEAIEDNKQAKLLIYNDDAYQEFSLSATTLPVVKISMDISSDDPDEPIHRHDTKADFTLFDNRQDIDPEERIAESQTYIRLRGASSLNFSKKQFRLNLREFTIGGDESNEHLSLLGMREDDDWILHSPYNDPEKMRNLFATNMWHDVMGEHNPFGINTGTQGKVVEVFIDDQYWGIYTLMHPIDAKSLNLNLDKSETSDFYYRSVSNVDFLKDDFISDSSGPIRGRFELREPSPSGEQFQWEPIINHMSALEYDKDKLNTYLNDFTHLPNQMDYFLFVLFLQATDNDRKNHNYIAKYVNDKHLIIDSPWDLDLILGLHWTPDHPRISEFRGDPNNNFTQRTSLVKRAIDLGDEEIIHQFSNHYSNLRQNEWSKESLMGIVDKYEADIYHSGSILRNQERWPTAAYAPDTSEFREYMLQRLSSMDGYIEELVGGERFDE